MKKDDSYYGGFFWVAVTSFIVPLFVAYAAFDKLSPTTKPTPTPDASGVDQNLWDYLVRTYVEHGLVDYEGLSKDYLFTTYLGQVASCDPSKLESRDDQLALHCNAYNALVINGVINHKIHQNEKNVLNFTPKEVADEIAELDKQIEAIKRSPEGSAERADLLMKKADKLRADSNFFRIQEYIFANETISLDTLEHKIIRPTFQDPRVHVALVCAAKSCPAIRGEAYLGARVNEQLDDQARQFANNETYVSYDPIDETVQLSPILSWYGEDWDADGGYLKWLSERVEDTGLRDQVVAADAGDTKVAFNSYDWGLNSQAGSSGGGGAGGGGFGSGSVPNE
ncbi:MAG: DUF547 domain-containing protein [Planctomycetota bacterium]